MANATLTLLSVSRKVKYYFRNMDRDYHPSPNNPNRICSETKEVIATELPDFFQSTPLPGSFFRQKSTKYSLRSL